MCSTLTYNQHNNYLGKQAVGRQQLPLYKSKVSPSRRLKNLLKPLLGRVFKSKTKQSKRNSYIACEEKEDAFEWLHNDVDNLANEFLEQRLMNELKQSNDGEAIIVYNEDGFGRLESIDKEDLYVPVHFARTEAGTFFWTSIQRETIKPYQIEWNFLDRWAQA